MEQDSLGFVWIGTSRGLSRYDGYDFKNWAHQTDNPNSLSNNVIWDILVDIDNSLWLATENGLNHFKPRTETFEHYFHQPDDPNTITYNWIMGLELDTNGNIWIGTDQGLAIFNRAEQRFEQIVGPEEGVARAIESDHLGRMWYGHENVLICKDLKEEKVNKYELPKCLMPKIEFESSIFLTIALFG